MKRLKRKNYKKWVHFSIGQYGCFGFKAICGRESPMCEHLRTTTFSDVTCPRCIDALKKRANGESL